MWITTNRRLIRSGVIIREGALNADLSKQEIFDKIKELANGKNIDAIIAGSPCQGFYVTGSCNFDDPRNKLYLAVIRMVKQYQPKGFIIENVPGTAILYHGEIKEEIFKRFRAMNYNIECKILCATDYGVPQINVRTQNIRSFALKSMLFHRADKYRFQPESACGTRLDVKYVF